MLLRTKGIEKSQRIEKCTGSGSQLHGNRFLKLFSLNISCFLDYLLANGT